jgi:magnesium transporter
MQLETRLAQELMQRHPERAAAVLERAGVGEAVRLLGRGEVGFAAALAERTSPFFAADLLESLPPERAAEILGRLGLDTAARLLRRVREDLRERLLESSSPEHARGLRSLLRFPEGTAGALMDPDVLALPEDLTAAEALARVREAPARARYNLYVVDREQRLVGVLNLRELLLARPGDRLEDRMVRDPQCLRADADRASVLAHSGWREVHAIPVVDEAGCYLGAVRYHTLRELEASLLGRRGEDGRAAAALGELFAAGAAGLLEALAPPGGGTDGGGAGAS